MSSYEGKQAQRKPPADQEPDATSKPGSAAFRLADNRPQAQTVQRRIKQNRVEYSFLEAYDTNGNPYLASAARGVRRNWAMKEDQPNIKLEAVDDLHEDLTDENRESFFHNLSMGREQRATVGGQKSIFAPFKSYQFGPNKVPDIAVFNVGESGADKGALYPDYGQRLRAILQSDMQAQRADVTLNELAKCKLEMLPLILGEEYRTRGALEWFDSKWTELVDAFKHLHELRSKAAPETGRPKRGRVDPVEEQEKLVRKAILQVSINLPWAGNNGKEKFRKTVRETKGTWEESERPVDRSGMSPQRDDTGGHWEPMEESSQLKKKDAAPGGTVQARFKKADEEFSFLSLHDLNGNPLVASGEDDEVQTWKIKQAQTGLAMTAQDDLHTVVNDDNRDDIYHNLSMGRQQRVVVGGQRAILHPFKSYQFGTDAVPEVAVYNVGSDGVEPAALYPDYYKQVAAIVNTFLGDRDYEQAKAALDKKKAEMLPLITAEDYRTRGALDYFETVWRELNAALLAARRKSQRNDSKLEAAAVKVSKGLPWAGTGGKQAFRTQLSETMGTWEESSRPVDRSTMSPPRDDTGGKWE